MDTLEGTSWDVLISGTGIQQSLLALALSRCGKKVLHVDKNDIYGGSEAALSLQEAEQWSEKVNSAAWRSPFHHASISRPTGDGAASKLGSPRSYSLSLAPTLLYTRSNLLLVLVSSKVHQQLEFQAVGSWYVYDKQSSAEESGQDGDKASARSELIRVPNGREDIFADKMLSLKAKGALTKFLRFVAVYEEKPEIWEAHKDSPFSDFLTQQFNLPVASHGPLLALSLSSLATEATSTGFALPRIARHLRSIGAFGAGFSSVIPKWGGLSEIAQVACRAGAVGGAVYVLGKSIESIGAAKSGADDDDDVEEILRPELSQQDISKEVSDAIGANNFIPTDQDSLDKYETEIKDQSLDELLAAAGYSIGADESSETNDNKLAEKSGESLDVAAGTSEPKRKLSVRLEGGEEVTTDYIVGTRYDIPEGQAATDIASLPSGSPTAVSRSISVVSGPLPELFPRTSEGGVIPAGAVIVFPSGSLDETTAQTPPVYITAHTGDTGECPQGQTVFYASIAMTGGEAFSILEKAVDALLATQGSEAEVIWKMQYQQEASAETPSPGTGESRTILRFPDTPLDLAFDDTLLDNVNKAWRQMTGDEVEGFLQFEDREVAAEENSEDED